MHVAHTTDAKRLSPLGSASDLKRGVAVPRAVAALVALLGFTATAVAQTQQSTVDGTYCRWDAKPISFTYSVSKGTMPNSTTIWIDEYTNGVRTSTGVYWMQTDGSGTLAANLPEPTSPTFGSYSPVIPAGPYTSTITSVATSPNRTLKTRDTVGSIASGTVIGTIPSCTYNYVTTPGDPSHSTWDCSTTPSQVITVSYIGTGTPISGKACFHYSLLNPARNKSHTVSLKYNGTQVAATTAIGGLPYDNTVTLDYCTPSGGSHNGDAWQIYVDGVLQNSGTIALTNDGTTEAPIWDATVNGAYSAGADPVQPATPTPSVAATAPPTGTATPTVPPQVTATPGTTSVTTGGGSTINGQNVFVANPGDIYNPIVSAVGKLPSARDIYDNVRNALQDAGNGSAAPTADTSHNDSTYGRGHIDDLQTTLQGVRDNKDSVVSHVTSTLSQLMSDATSLGGQTFGSVVTIPMNFNTIGHAPAVGAVTFLTAIDLTPWLGMIGVLRGILTWLLRLAFWVLTFKLCASQGVRV